MIGHVLNLDLYDCHSILGEARVNHSTALVVLLPVILQSAFVAHNLIERFPTANPLTHRSLQQNGWGRRGARLLGKRAAHPSDRDEPRQAASTDKLSHKL